MASIPKKAQTIEGHISELYRRMHNIENSNTIDGGATFSKGALRGVDPNNGETVFFVGLAPIPDGSGRMQMIVDLQRDDGTSALQLTDDGTTPGHTHQQAFQLFDRSGNIWAADDTTSGQGMARPYIPICNFVDATVPTATTTSTSFVTLQSGSGFKQHPKIEGQILVYADTGTTGTIQLVDQASNVLFTHTLTSGEFDYVNFGPVALAGTHEQTITLSIQGKVLTGAGKVGARGVSAIGVQT